MRLVLTFLPLLLLSASCSGPYSGELVSAKAEEPALVVVTRIAVEAIPEVISATGELFAEEQATIGAEVAGRVVKLHVDLGSVVSAGQALAEIQRDEYEFRLTQAEALVSQTRARLGILDRKGDDVTPEETAIVRRAAAGLKEARFIFQTSQTLAKEGVISKIEFEKAGVALDASEAGYQSALEDVMQLRAQLSERRAEVELARQNLDDCVIRAPFDGAVTQRIASLGEYLTVNSPLLTLVRQDPLRLRLEVPERAAGKVRIGLPIAVRVEGAGPGHTGRVVRLSPVIMAESRSLLLEGAVPNPHGLLRPGAFAEGVITVDANARGIAVPRDAVLTFAGVERAFLVENGRLADRIVKTGRLLGDDRVEILEGLEDGDSVVREVSDRLVPGQPAVIQ